MATDEEEREKVSATLTRVIFSKQETGFVIGAFDVVVQAAEGFKLESIRPISAVGTMINPQIGVEYQLTGEWVEDARFGRQFKFSAFETIMPADPNGIFKYIVRICKYVGGAVGTRLVDKYGADTLTVMKDFPEKIAEEIKGLTLDRALEIQEALLENEGDEAVMVELEIILDVPGMRKNLSVELVKKFRSNAAEAVKANPYVLTMFHGVGFPLADRVALNVGYARDGIERKKAACLHCILESMQEGNVWVTHENLLSAMKDLIQIKGLDNGIDDLISDGAIVYEGQSISFLKSSDNEKIIACKLHKLATGVKCRN